MRRSEVKGMGDAMYPAGEPDAACCARRGQGGTGMHGCSSTRDLGRGAPATRPPTPVPEPPPAVRVCLGTSMR